MPSLPVPAGGRRPAGMWGGWGRRPWNKRMQRAQCTYVYIRADKWRVEVVKFKQLSIWRRRERATRVVEKTGLFSQTCKVFRLASLYLSFNFNSYIRDIRLSLSIFYKLQHYSITAVKITQLSFSSEEWLIAYHKHLTSVVIIDIVIVKIYVYIYM